MAVLFSELVNSQGVLRLHPIPSQRVDNGATTATSLPEQGLRAEKYGVPEQMESAKFTSKYSYTRPTLLLPLHCTVGSWAFCRYSRSYKGHTVFHSCSEWYIWLTGRAVQYWYNSMQCNAIQKQGRLTWFPSSLGSSEICSVRGLAVFSW